MDDPKWELVRRILHVGFQISIDLRFQSAQDLLERLEEIDAGYDHVKPNVAGASQIAVQTFNDLLSTEIARSFDQIMVAMLDASRLLEDALEAKAHRAGLRSIHFAGRSRVDESGRRVHFCYDLTRANVGSPWARLQHNVLFVGKGRSNIAARYSIGGQETCYYEGPAADVLRLKDEMLAQTDGIFAACVDELRRLLESQIRP